MSDTDDQAGGDTDAVLSRAIQDLDIAAVSRISRTIAAQLRRAPTRDHRDLALTAMHLVHGKRLNEQTMHLCEALLASGYDEPLIRHRYAIALIDSGYVMAARELLAGVGGTLSPTATAEIEAARGRIAKEQYLASSGSAAAVWMAEAVERYDRLYRTAPDRPLYHGINLAALLCRAEVDEIPVDAFPAPRAAATAIADDILARIRSTVLPSIWECATAAEAGLVLGDDAEVVRWALRYTASEADAFEFGSTLRQFEEVWRLTAAAEPGKRVVPLLQQAVLRSTGGRLLLPSEQRAHRVQALRGTISSTLDEQTLHSLGWLQTGLSAGQAVGRIDSRMGTPIGTCFLVQPGPSAAPVIVTCAHVVPFGVAAENAVATFHGTVKSESIPVSVLHSDPALDATVLQCEGPTPPVSALRAESASESTLGSRRQQISLIGHPHGAQEQWLALDNSTVVGIDDQWISYRSPTMAGNSGSPAFDRSWRLVGMHTGYHEPSHANRAVRLDRIALNG